MKINFKSGDVKEACVLDFANTGSDNDRIRARLEFASHQESLIYFDVDVDIQGSGFEPTVVVTREMVKAGVFTADDLVAAERTVPAIILYYGCGQQIEASPARNRVVYELRNGLGAIRALEIARFVEVFNRNQEIAELKKALEKSKREKADLFQWGCGHQEEIASLQNFLAEIGGKISADAHFILESRSFAKSKKLASVRKSLEVLTERIRETLGTDQDEEDEETAIHSER